MQNKANDANDGCVIVNDYIHSPTGNKPNI